MPQRVPSLQLPLPRSEAARETNRQLIVWAGRMVSVLNSLSADPGLKNSGNPGSAVTTLPFSGSGAAIDISGLMHFVEGGVSLATIKPPQGFSGMFFMIAASSFALVAGGNIVVPGGSVALRTGEMVPMVFDGKTWYASVPIASNLLNIKIITFADSPYSVTPIDEVILASAGTGADTIVVLPPATGSGRPLDVKKIDANPYSIAVTPANADTIDDGSGPLNILARYTSDTLVDYSAGKWAIL
ncbi:MAG TPA: hypothetical protein VGY99_32830 [Candidatus Binataceae bacterium]|jgi:hypothetical protein|nr:hypothetical protein [Candidatus Binataceae bacterium]